MKEYSKLSARERVGQLLFFGFDGIAMNDHVRTAIRDYHMGNIILFSRNFSNAEQLFHLTQQLQSYALEQNGVQLFIAVDQEGGSVVRFQRDLTWFPGSMAIAATGEESAAFAIGSGLGYELKEFGINLNLAPVANLCNNPDSPHIGSRSYNDNPAEVARYAAQYIKGLQQYAVATAKHFPSIGSSNVDLHLHLGVNSHPLEYLRGHEMDAVHRLVQSGVKNVMISHERYPALDTLPATLSRRVVTDILRNEYGYKNLIISDCMEMRALDDYCGTVNGCVGAIQAGIDMLLVCHTRATQQQASDALLEAAEKGTITEERLRDAVERILYFKQEYNVNEFLSSEYIDIEQRPQFIKNRQNAREISRSSLTALSNPDFFTFAVQNKMLFVSTPPAATTMVDAEDCAFSVASAVQEAFPHADSIELPLNPDEEQGRRVAEKVIAESYDKVIVFTYNAHQYAGQCALLRQLVETGRPIGAVAMRNPFDAACCGGVQAQLLAYEYTPLSVESLMAVFKGELKPTGRLPIALPQQPSGDTSME